MSEERPEPNRSSGRPLELALTAGQRQPERLPGLLAILDQLPAYIAEEAKSLIQTDLKIKTNDVAAATFSETGGVPQSGVCGVLWCEKLHQRLYCFLDAISVFSILDLALGGSGSRPAPLTVRDYSQIDLAILEIFFKRLNRALTNAFSILVDLQFEATHVLQNIAEVACRPSTPVISARLMFEWSGEPGFVSLVIPQIALEPIREEMSKVAAQVATVTVNESDTQWSRQLSEELARAFVVLNAVCEERPIALSAVRQFTPGKVLELGPAALSSIRLDVEENPAFWCQLGKAGTSLCLMVDRKYDEDEAAAAFAE